MTQFLHIGSFDGLVFLYMADLFIIFLIDNGWVQF